MVKNYKTVSLPNDIVKLVDEVVEKSNFYQNRADFIKSSVRGQLKEEIKKQEAEAKA